LHKQTGAQTLWSLPFTLIMLGMLFIFIPYSLYLPVLPAYLLQELHSSMQTAGAINGVFLAAAVLVRAQTARLEARFGVRRVLLAGSFLFMATNVMYLGAGSVPSFMLIRFLSGACFAVVNTSLTALGSRLIPLPRQGEGLAYLMTMVLAGAAIGPYLGLRLSHDFGYQSVFVFATLATLLGLLIIYFIAVQEERSRVRPGARFHDLYEIKAVPVSLIVLLLAVSYGGVLTFVVLYATNLGLPSVAHYFFVVMASASVLSRLVAGRMYDRFGPNVAIYSAIFILAAGLLTLGGFQSTAGMLSAAALIGVGYGVAMPSMQALAVQISPVHRSSAVTATFFTCLDGGIGLGAYLLGGCIHAFGYGAVYLALGGLTLSCLLFFYATYTRRYCLWRG